MSKGALRDDSGHTCRYPAHHGPSTGDREMKSALFGLFAACALLPGLALADGNPPPDPFDYNALTVDRLGIRSDFFADRSSGNGLKLVYDSQDSVYYFGQWNHLVFSKPGSHNL